MDNPLELREAETAVFKKPLTSRAYEWVQKFFRVVAGPFRGQLWKATRAPHAELVLDVLDREETRKVFMIWPSQGFKTTTAIGWIFTALQRRMDNVAHAMADEKAVNRMLTGTVTEAIKKCPPLRKRVKPGGFTKDEIRFDDGSAWIGVWAGSDSRTRSFSAPIVLIDEEDTYDDPGVVLAIEERPDAYHDLGLSKIIRTCRPKGNEEKSTIWADAQAQADCWLVREAVCPACSHPQIMEHADLFALGRIKDPKLIRSGKLARYACKKCGYRWDDRARDKAMGLGRWVARRGAVDNGVIFAFHLRSWEIPGQSLSDILATWFEAQGNPRLLQKFDNNICAKPYKFAAIDTDHEAIAAFISKRIPHRQPPEWTLGLTLSGDMQKDHFRFSVCAHGLAPRREVIIDYGEVGQFSDLTRLIFGTRYDTADGRNLGIWRASLDTGGGKNKNEADTRPVQAYLWLASQRPGVVFGTKGMSRKTPGVLVKRSVIETLPDGRKLGGGLALYLIDTDAFKRDIFWRLSEGGAEEAPLMFHASTDEPYLKEIASEKLVKKKGGKEEWERTRANHYLDCLVQHVAMAWWQWQPSLAALSGLGVGAPTQTTETEEEPA
ncbi:terminase gpA endonuclease subunit [Desulfoluna butyratoxydans]|uniref:Bacteriophage lambda gpa n=1 Tax=Desulfoluna butyratoxydans TaxID=231438 RepID=A0A4U8YRI6_9BACT|nr:terminase gpA endonuclease subunit [Desulfoluna butyratoxydans]VFQ44402.1 bacteriophage lambda gpa [Desulfoluna butyratoxydans]